MSSKKKKTNKQSVSVSRKKSESHAQVPSDNVLDLRQAMTSRQLRRVQEENEKKVAEAKEKLQHLQSVPKKKKKKEVSTVPKKRTKRSKTKKKKTVDAAVADFEYAEKNQKVEFHEPVQNIEETKMIVNADHGFSSSTKEEKRKKKVEQKELVAKKKVENRNTKQAAKEEKRKRKSDAKEKKRSARLKKKEQQSEDRIWTKPLVVSTIGFVIVAMIVMVPAIVSSQLKNANDIEQRITAAGEQAFVHIEAAATNIQELQFDVAEKDFEKAQNALEDAQIAIAEIPSPIAWLAQYVPGKGKTFHSGKQIIDAVYELSVAGELIMKSATELSDIDIATVAKDEDTGVTALLVLLHSAIAPASDNVDRASALMQDVDAEAVPEAQRAMVQQAITVLPDVAAIMQQTVDATELLLAFLGHEESKRYLVLFQNNHEMRATGGFPGSIALIDITNGVVTQMDVPGGGVYDVAGQLNKQVISPAPFHLINPHWNIQDANWFPHFPTSAQKIEWFYEHSGGPSIDGIVTVTPSVVEQFFTSTDLEVDLTEEHGVIITADNFYEEVQVRAEQKYDVTTESKAIIGDLTEELFNEVFSSMDSPLQMMEMAGVLKDSLDTKNILVYMNDPSLQKIFSAYGWTGELKETDMDYLHVSRTNIAGGKTDGFLDESIEHHAEIQEDGSIIDTVTFTRVHKGEEGHPLHGVHNTSYIRFYVPEGAELLSAEGFEAPDPTLFKNPDAGYEYDEDLREISGKILVDDETGISTNVEFSKTVFGGWMTTRLGQSATVTISYKLPQKISFSGLFGKTDTYSLLMQKQPGTFDHFFTSTISIPESMAALRTTPTDFTGTYTDVLSDDVFIGMVLVPEE